MADGREGGDRLSQRLAVGMVADQFDQSGLVCTGYAEGVDGDMDESAEGPGRQGGGSQDAKILPRVGGPSPEDLWISPVALTRHPRARAVPRVGYLSPEMVVGRFRAFCSLGWAGFTAHGCGCAQEGRDRPDTFSRAYFAKIKGGCTI